MSFAFLDFVNSLILEETLEMPDNVLVSDVLPDHFSIERRVSRFREIANNVIREQGNLRLASAKAQYSGHQSSPSLLDIARRKIPNSIDDVFAQIVSIVTSQTDAIPSNWTLAHRQESKGKNNDEELRNIWIRMYMLGLFSDTEGSESSELD